MARDEIARAVRAVRVSCFGRKCLAKCARRMTAAAPLRRSRCGGAAAVAAVLLLAMSARAVVFCTWNGSEYVCSGSGDAVTVTGGGPSGPEGGGDIVVTNMVGVCTNCVAMSPQYVRDWKSHAHDKISSIVTFAEDIYWDMEYLIFYISQYTNTYPVSGLDYAGRTTQTVPTLSEIRSFLTNYVDSSSRPVDIAEDLTGVTYSQAVGSANSIPGLPLNWRQNFITAYDAAATCFNEFSGNAQIAVDYAERTKGFAQRIPEQLSALDSSIDLLSEEECTAQWDGASGGGSGGGESGGGSTIVTNQISGNWCTYDQGEAIKELLDDIKEWGEKQMRYLQAISNRVASIDETIKGALFTSYTHIPTEDELQTSWQDLYLSGGNGNFPEYPATNIVARIELLLAGISGVLTNVNDYASQDEFADESLDSTNLVETAIGDMTNEFVNVMQGRASSARSVGDALIGLYQKFRTWSGTPFSVENLINSYSVELEDGKSLDIPGFAAPAKTLPWANLIRVVCRSAMSVIWILMTVAVFVRFQIAFFQWCFKYVKWAVEVLQGLFV